MKALNQEHDSIFDESKKNAQLQNIEDIAINFYHWMKRQDHVIYSEKYFHFSDKDMFNEFLKTKINYEKTI